MMGTTLLGFPLLRINEFFTLNLLQYNITKKNSFCMKKITHLYSKLVISQRFILGILLLLHSTYAGNNESAANNQQLKNNAIIAYNNGAVADESDDIFYDAFETAEQQNADQSTIADYGSIISEPENFFPNNSDQDQSTEKDQIFYDPEFSPAFSNQALSALPLEQRSWLQKIWSNPVKRYAVCSAILIGGMALAHQYWPHVLPSACSLIYDNILPDFAKQTIYYANDLINNYKKHTDILVKKSFQDTLKQFGEYALLPKIKAKINYLVDSYEPRPSADEDENSTL